MVYEVGKPTPKAYIRYSGVWDMQELYEQIAEWFRKRKFKLNEKLHEHRPTLEFGRERQYEWYADRKEDEFLQFRYNIFFHTFDSTDIPVILPNGQEKVFTKGRIFMELKVEAFHDHEGRWSETHFFRYLKDFYNKYVFRKRWMTGFSPKLRNELYQLHAMILHTLKLETDSFQHMHVGGVHKKSV